MDLLDVMSHMHVVMSVQRHFHSSTIWLALIFKLVVLGFKLVESLISCPKFLMTLRIPIQRKPFLLTGEAGYGVLE